MKAKPDTIAGATAPSARPHRGQYLRLSVSVLLSMGLWFSASAIMPQLGAHWDLDAGARAWLTASVQLGFVVGALASALFGVSDRVPVNRLIAISAALAALCNALIAVDGVGYPAALALRGATGVLLAGVYPPGMKLVASWTRERRGLWVGVLIGALTAGSSMPHLLNAVGSMPAGAAAIVGSADADQWRGLLLGASALAATGAVLALPLRTGPFVSRASRFHWREVPALLTARDVRLANFGYLGHMWELYAMWTWVPFYLMLSFTAGGLSDTSARWAAFATIAIGAPGCAIAGWIADRIGRSLTTVGAMAASGTCALLAAAAFGHPWLLTAICLLWGLTVVADSAQFSTAVSELADPSRIGTALTLQTALGFLLTMVSIQLLPLLAQALNWQAAIAVLALGPAAGCVAMLRLRSLPEAAAMAGGRR